MKKRAPKATKNHLTLPYILGRFEYIQDVHFVASNGIMTGSNIQAYGDRVNMSEIQQILLEANSAARQFPPAPCKPNPMILGGGALVVLIALILTVAVPTLGALLALVGACVIGFGVWKAQKDRREQNNINNLNRAKAVQGVLDKLNCSQFYNSDFTTTVDTGGRYILIEVSHVMGGEKPNRRRYPNPQAILSGGGHGAGGVPVTMVNHPMAPQAVKPNTMVMPQPSGYVNPGMAAHPGMNHQMVGQQPMGINPPGPMAPGVGPQPGAVMNHSAYPVPPTASMLNQPAPGIHGSAFNQVHPAPQAF